ncbi:MAG: hypothetical protein WBC52_05805, partial [Candidatus Omnitrophota bacterium]
MTFSAQIKERIFFILLFSVLACLAFWDILLLKTTFNTGDYFQQFYPWSSFYAENIKNFRLPLWTRYVQSGFPLFAEGQIGMLYPLNILFFFALPFKFAYNHSFLFHFVFAGFFMFLYSRKIGLDKWGSFLAATILCFSSVYAGCFINTSTLKALCYFPLILFIFESYLESRKRHTGYFLIIGFLWGIQLLAGSFQMTAYSILLSALYFLYRGKVSGIRSGSICRGIVVSGILAVLVSLPQIWATFELAGYSSRASRTLGFALWNSFSPPALLGSFLPPFGSVFIRTNIIYVGVLSLFFVFVALKYLKSDKAAKTGLLFLILGLFVALGKYNPVYVLILWLTKYYSFRGPAKAIYFAVFGLSILAGSGFSRFFAGNDGGKLKKVSRVFILTAASVTALYFAARAILGLFGAGLMGMVKSYVAAAIYGKPFHRHDLDFYMSKVESLFAALPARLSFANPYILFGIIALGITILFVILREKIKKGHITKLFCLIFIFLDLYFLSFYFEGPRSAAVKADEDISHKAIFETVENDKTLFRIFPYGSQKDLPKGAYFSANMDYKIDSIGLYTPLMNRDYYLKLRDLGVVDDSIGITTRGKETIEQNRGLLEKLNVKYIVTGENLDFSFLEKIMTEDGVNLYRIKSFYPRFWLAPASDPGVKMAGKVEVEEYDSGFAKVRVRTDKAAYL